MTGSVAYAAARAAPTALPATGAERAAWLLLALPAAGAVILLLGGNPMSSFPWLTVAGAIPLAGSVVVVLTPGQSTPGGAVRRRAPDPIVKWIALGFTVATLAVTPAMAAAFGPGGPDFQFTQTYRWIPQFGAYYAVGVDGIALVWIVMTAVLTPLVVPASWNAVEGDAGLGFLVGAVPDHPKPALDVINPAVRSTLVQVHATDPVPPHPAAVHQAASLPATVLRQGSTPGPAYEPRTTVWPDSADVLRQRLQS